jgi:hypothetical protein
LKEVNQRTADVYTEQKPASLKIISNLAKGHVPQALLAV